MEIPLKQLFFAFTFNSILFLVLILGIQNSANKSKVNFLKTNSIELPISFIVGSSFISGSILGSLLTIKFKANVN
tara:strand:- start:188 stop:412 length:225 start_codon:yes stop_codon:yes gene_type:complete